MKATWEKLENNQGVLTVEVEEARVDKAIDQAFVKVVKKVNVPGFRKGKVPRKIFEARFGVESLYQDALDIILPEAYTEAVQETGIEPVDRPEVDIQQIAKGQPLIFKATVTVKPEVKLGEYKGLTVEEKDFSVTDEMVEEELKNMQNRSAELVVLEDDATIEKGDYAIIDFKGFVDGEAFEGGEADNYQLEIGSGTFIPGFEDQVIGMKKGEEKDINVTFPEEYHAKELAGKPAVFKVKVNEIKRKNLPELDDEFAKDVSEFDTLEELKADIKNKLEEKAKIDAENYKKEALIEKATENAEIDLPEVMVEHEVNHMVNDFAQRLQFQGMNLDLYYQFTGLDEEKLREQFQPDAEKRVRTTLVLEAIGKAENVEVTDEDVNKELEELSEQYNRPVEELRKIFEARDNLESLKNDIRIRKTIDLLVESSK
ncbi:trigger factor [Aneurinibacillus thermoaerophilus]|uniref:Trigger factor n=1 Tax=Aneurinibacillus thermoaerophilus TaxID=143495 RepID=A0A1G7ZUG1_ANETH|nr:MULTISPECIES: trigger factor [Aneurinibacillus]AMA72079.1 trigger factor [Aneurinibacillus sp. XH2]MED0676361.1 trigger factor [Aneurinibacillus thermoaerophilus]MED0678873.1 trigger factor [Aneurinibacillus thermoaerophilus]MED0755913.1 trigger factor [Aneurinibacillus thermoaerophilus]MED0759763.1 trigger factor [Aneurinibacillus thermoaerophilus]